MKDTAIVPNNSIRDLAPQDILKLKNEVEEITAVYEEANSSLEELSHACVSLNKVGERYNELTNSVRRRINEITSKGILKTVEA